MQTQNRDFFSESTAKHGKSSFKYSIYTMIYNDFYLVHAAYWKTADENGLKSHQHHDFSPFIAKSATLPAAMIISVQQ